MMQDMEVGVPMERLHLNLTGRHPSVNGLTYICTAMCGFTKLAVAWPMRDKKALWSGLGSLLYFSTSLQSKKVLEKSNEVQVKSTLLENYLSKK